MAHDILDAFAAALFTFASASKLDLADVSLMNTSLTETAYSLAGVDITWGTVVALGTLGGAAVLNSPSWDRFTQEQQALVGATVGLVVVGTFVPELTDALAGSIWIALATVGIEAGGYWAVAQSS